MLRKKRFLIGGIIVVIAISCLAYMGFQDSATYYYSVGELTELGTSIYGENIRVNGKVAPSTVKQDSQETSLEFNIIDNEGKESLHIVYHGVVPDTFKAGNEVVVEGSLDSTGTLQANTILAKCPSKYAAEE